MSFGRHSRVSTTVTLHDIVDVARRSDLQLTYSQIHAAVERGELEVDDAHRVDAAEASRWLALPATRELAAPVVVPRLVVAVGHQHITRKACPTCHREVEVVADGNSDAVLARHFAIDRRGFCVGSLRAAPSPSLQGPTAGPARPAQRTKTSPLKDYR